MAENKLVIVESPTKARTIGKMLGKGYTIMASMGHIRDLPERTLGVDIKNDFKMEYVESERGAKVIKELKAASKKADAIYLAPDPDREGEAIAWHLKEVLSKQNKKSVFHRVAFHEITKSAIDKAFKAASDINMDLVDAQQARRVIDRLVGYKVSPMVKRNVTGGSSAGRVQSVALLLACEREEQIRKFIPEEYWDFTGTFKATSGDSFDAKMFRIADKKAVISNGEQAAAAVAALENNRDSQISAIDTVPKRRHAAPPYITSTLQQSANSLLKMSATRTMQIAQQLYEGIDVSGDSSGLITYMRTDSVNIAQEARNSCREFIQKTYGNEYLPAKPNFYKSGKAAQEAHEAIRPTDITRTPEMMAKYLDHNQLRVYTIIWRRFVASQMKPCEQSQTTVTVSVAGADGKNYEFRASALVTTFPGFMKVNESQRNTDEEKLEMFGRLKKEQSCQMTKLDPVQKFTEPPSRYSEASLIKELEARGVGRPSTYATIIRTIQLREYVTQTKGILTPTDSGMKVNEFLQHALPELINVDYTSKMEEDLDQVEEGNLKWTGMLQDFHEKFLIWLKHAKKSNSVEPKRVKALLDMFSDVKWDPPRKIGKKVYDDQKFYESLVEDFDKTKQCTKRQWGAVLTLAVHYAQQLGNVKTALQEAGMPPAEIDELLKTYKEREQSRKEKMADDDEVAKNERIFALLKDIELEKERPAGRGGKAFNEEKFFKSLKDQALSGKILSPKQNSALLTIVKRHSESITEFAEVCQLLGADIGEVKRELSEKSEFQEIYNKVFPMFDKVEWAKPSGRSRKNDEAFFKSLKSQALNGKILSEKQVAALVKLATKYQELMPEYAEFCKLMGVDPTSATEEKGTESLSAADRAKLDEMLKFMDGITEWEKPIKRGKKTFSDEKFYQSLKKQFESGKALSEKQVSALQKMISKYQAD